MLLPVDLIKIPDDRQRKTFKDLDTLAASIARYGLLQPIVVDTDHNLIAGERRLRAVKLLSMNSIECRLIDSLTPPELSAIEFIENAQRMDLSWQERCAAVAKYSAMRTDFSFTVMAEELCMSERHLRSMLDVGREIESGNEEVVKQATQTAAINYTRRQNTRAQNAERADIFQTALAHVTETEEEAPIIFNEMAPILNLNFIEWAANYGGKLFNVIHCDFPYGIGADKHNFGAAKSFGGYADSSDVYWHLIATFVEHQDKFIAPDAHLIFWFSPKYFAETKTALTEAGWKVDDYPLIWHKNDNSGIAPVPDRLPRRIYEMAFICYKGDSRLISMKSNLFSAPNIKTIHQSQKNPAMLTQFFSMVVDQTTSFLDPTCGSGMALHAAKNCGAGYILGIEKDLAFYTDACSSWADFVAAGDLFV